jgi:hypothetical protein
MTLSPKIVFALRSAATVVAGLALTDCVVRSQPQPVSYQMRAQPTYVAQPAPQPVYQQQPVYAQPQPVYQQQPPPVVVQQQQPNFGAPPPVVSGNMGAQVGGVGFGVGAQVGGGWTTDGYAESDYVSYHMSIRARQFAAGFYPITQLFRAQAGQGQRQYVTVTATPGRCYRIIGVGGQGVRDLDLRLRDQSGNVVDQDVATDNFPVLGLQRPLCLNWTGTFQIEVIMYSGGGEFGVQAFAQ